MRLMRQKLWLLTLLAMLSPVSKAYGLTGADVAIYNDTTLPDGGAWVQGLEAIKLALDASGYSHEDITPDDVNGTKDLNTFFKVIMFGGGWAGGYNTYITRSGYTNLRNFVVNGGRYFGICAGSYFPADRVFWKPDYETPGELYNYPFNLFKGIGVGALLGIKEWTAATGCDTGITEGAAMTTVAIKTSVLPGIGSQLAILYYGGPFFVPAAELRDSVTVLATYQIPAGGPGDGKPAMILFPYGKGKVFLSGPHPEVSFDANGCALYYDSETWKLMDSVMQLLMAGGEKPAVLQSAH